MEEALLPSNDFAIRLPAFEGPLDLLLYLIRRNEVDIYDIPIEHVTTQYIEVLDSMENLDLEVAGEFFVMAATLMYIKSRMLLPQKDQGSNLDVEEDDIDPRWELVQQLLEYKKFKEASSEIEELILNSNDLIARIGPKEALEAVERPLKPVERVDLWNTFNQVLRRLAERITTGEINAEQVTVADRMEFILLRFKAKPNFLFSELFESTTTITTIVATFLAVLELTRLGEILIQQDRAFSDIRCQRGTNTGFTFNSTFT
ncbi:MULTISPECIES: ScpA family protein [unclassified Lentimonas]|uniref:segregation and condensation protein A n=1 Tax=unclassified Lentimonas TaxID=2630993 RepID=UPI001328114F|nr:MULTISPECIES: segregation/condensation protein A [unclassified Lentimonas]CAA6678893.1 Segregation and condensation protein A [Lentimonas sp. CC4]CAA6684499.1 Segregation and condensation protein A [Lentimonas sp. CC6]CAA6693817.1 Segregation and condensation protein A [Lentimonas sp. CC19]CAA6695119.1 Segregation and condensation protein A [Lentimonas sp. CC10]CAA7069695.1 Segregation and condensation protein A [Lentimonas sp. CC11]